MPGLGSLINGVLTGIDQEKDRQYTEKKRGLDLSNAEFQAERSKTVAGQQDADRLREHEWQDRVRPLEFDSKQLGVDTARQGLDTQKLLDPERIKSAKAEAGLQEFNLRRAPIEAGQQDARFDIDKERSEIDLEADRRTNEIRKMLQSSGLDLDMAQGEAMSKIGAHQKELGMMGWDMYRRMGPEAAAAYMNKYNVVSAKNIATFKEQEMDVPGRGKRKVVIALDKDGKQVFDTVHKAPLIWDVEENENQYQQWKGSGGIGGKKGLSMRTPNTAYDTVKRIAAERFDGDMDKAAKYWNSINGRQGITQAQIFKELVRDNENNGGGLSIEKLQRQAATIAASQMAQQSPDASTSASGAQHEGEDAAGFDEGDTVSGPDGVEYIVVDGKLKVNNGN